MAAGIHKGVPLIFTPSEPIKQRAEPIKQRENRQSNLTRIVSCIAIAIFSFFKAFLCFFCCRSSSPLSKETMARIRKIHKSPQQLMKEKEENIAGQRVGSHPGISGASLNASTTSLLASKPAAVSSTLPMADPEAEETVAAFQLFVADFASIFAEEMAVFVSKNLSDPAPILDKNAPRRDQLRSAVKKIVTHLLDVHVKGLLLKVDFKSFFEKIVDTLLNHTESFLDKLSKPGKPVLSAAESEDPSDIKKTANLIKQQSQKLSKEICGKKSKSSASILFGERAQPSKKNAQPFQHPLERFRLHVKEKVLSKSEKERIHGVGKIVGITEKNFLAEVYTRIITTCTNLLTQLTAPDSLQQFLFPLLFDLMIKTYSKQIFRAHPDQLAPLFYRLVVQKDLQAKQAICDRMFFLCRKQAISLGKDAFNQIDRSSFNQHMEELINYYAAKLQQVPCPEKTSSPKFISAILRQLFALDNTSKQAAGKKPHLQQRVGQVVYQLLQHKKVGNFNSTVLNWNASSFQDTVGQLFSDAMADLATHHHHYLQRFFQLTREKMESDRPWVASLIDPDTLPVPVTITVNKVARLLNDMINVEAGGYRWVVKFISGGVAGLEKAIQNIANALMGSQERNLKVISQIQEVVMESLNSIA